MPDKTVIKIDIDSQFIELDVFKARLKRVMRIFKVNKVNVKQAKTNKGYHFYIDFPCIMNDYEVIIVQLIMDSDIEREIFNLERVRKGVQGWNVLFTIKKIRDQIVSRESDLVYFDVER